MLWLLVITFVRPLHYTSSFDLALAPISFVRRARGTEQSRGLTPWISTRRNFEHFAVLETVLNLLMLYIQKMFF
ncbi:hypothetical protein GALMADRAFT_581505 [Galerina marginata CBS 339.88]|uniref:Secreted protein n=1 Tax=Galerina marginata (strain CBS 339.88) TaxID=685588 RepID=A0A067SU16_GALM3|nr:hypothetical protein GALMADRAFT_581505 [Galerina marginata CBS 339.88]